MTDFLRSLVRDIPDFPLPGIVFRDVTPMLRDPHGLRESIRLMTETVAEFQPDLVLGIESRGFLFAMPVADRLGLGFVPARKPGKLPWAVHRQPYGLEYGTDVLELHVDAVAPGARVVIIDDVLATGGTARAACSLVQTSGATVAGVVVLVELVGLAGRSMIDAPVASVLAY
jgi:adenine phosphoribosyltransferase